MKWSSLKFSPCWWKFARPELPAELRVNKCLNFKWDSSDFYPKIIVYTTLFPRTRSREQFVQDRLTKGSTEISFWVFNAVELNGKVIYVICECGVDISSNQICLVTFSVEFEYCGNFFLAMATWCVGKCSWGAEIFPDFPQMLVSGENVRLGRAKKDGESSVVSLVLKSRRFEAIQKNLEF